MRRITHLAASFAGLGTIIPFTLLTVRTPIRAAALVGMLALILGGPSRAAAQDGLARAEALVLQARADADRFLQTKDGRAKDATGKSVKEAEKILRDLLKSDPSCEKCQEELVSALFERGVVGISKNYDDCLEEVGKGLARFPANGRLALFQGLANYYAGDFAAASRSIKRYLGSPSRTPERDAAATPILQDSQQRFLSNWYRQANFYQSPESRVTRLNPQTFVNEVTFQVTPEWELAVANQLAPALAQQGPAVSDTALVAYLEQLVARLVKGSPGPTFTYRTTIFDSAAVNATAVPGQIAVSTGLLWFVETEAELAAVLAHELAHTYGHHAARAVIKQYNVQNLVGSVAQAVNPQGAVAQGVTGIVASLGLTLFQRAYSRFEETEADLYGAHILYNGGYNPTAMSQVQLRMYERNSAQPIKFMSTHPPAPDRVETLTTYLEAFALDRELVLDSATFQKTIKGRTAAALLPATPQVAAAPPAVSRAPPPNPIPSAGSLPAATSLPPAARTPATPPPPVAMDLPPVQSPGAASLPPASTLPPSTLPPASTLHPTTQAPAASPAVQALPPPEDALPPVGGSARVVTPGVFVTPEPDSTPAPVSGGDDPLARMRGTWTSRTGDLVVRFFQTSEGFVGFLQKVPPAWAAAAIEAGDRLFDEGRPADKSTVSGQSLSLAPPGCDMDFRYGPATINIDTTGSTLTMTAFEPRTTPAPGCRATSQIDTKTYTFYRAPAR